MAPHALSSLVALSAIVTLAAAQTGVSGLTWAPVPLVDQFFPTPNDAPERVWPDEPAYARGPQTGYNRCNATTEGSNSLCQTSYVNDLSDFCLWAPPVPNSNIADTEGDEVAWCTKRGYGTRLMPEGALLGAQLLRSKDYYMITGLIDQTKLNMQANDSGGELDSGSQDGRGNPIGGLMYSTAFNQSVYQVNWWTEFIGNGAFCIKICNPSGSNEAGYCQHTLDRIGLGYNCPSKYTVGDAPAPGEFEVCDTDDMSVPGVYTDASGATQSYAQPAESVSISTIPYQPTTVASRNCVQTASSALYTELAAISTTSSSASSSTAAGASSSAPTSSGSIAPASSGSVAPTSSGSSSSAASGSGSSASSSLSASAKPSATGASTGSGSGSGTDPGTGTSAADKTGSAASSPTASVKSGASHVAVVGTALSIVAAGAAFIALI